MPKTPLLIQREYGLQDFERLLQRPDLGNHVLALPKSIRDGGMLGRSASLAQLVLTWAQSGEAPHRTQTFIESGNVENYVDFVSTLYGFTAAYFSDSAGARNSDSNIRRDLLRHSASRIEAMSQSDLAHTAKGRKVEFILARGAKNEFHRLLYKRTPTLAEIRDREKHGDLVSRPVGMSNLLRLCVHKLKLRSSSSLMSILNQNKDPFGQILHESFKNTAEHAYYDLDGNLPRRAMRSVTIAVQQVPRDAFDPAMIMSSPRPEARDYFQKIMNWEDPISPRKHITVLEISILDSGPGFAKTIGWTTASEEYIPFDDIHLVAQCFKKHQTAKMGPSSGVGLNRLLKAVHDLNGFVRFRTSTTEAFFAGGSGYDPMMEPTEFIQGKLAEVKGALLVIGLPIVR